MRRLLRRLSHWPARATGALVQTESKRQRGTRHVLLARVAAAGRTAASHRTDHGFGVLTLTLALLRSLMSVLWG